MLKKVYQEITPPLIQSWVKNIVHKKRGHFSGPYAKWHDGLQVAAGYDDMAILERVKQATLQVKNNRNLYVRDGVVFSTAQYPFPLFSALLKIAFENHGKLNIIDFGGGLGSSFYAFNHFCPEIQLQWQIIEQRNFVACGQQYFVEKGLSFYQYLHEISTSVDVILLSGCLQYLEDPYATLDKIQAIQSKYVILDRTWFDKSAQTDKIVIEHVPEHIYSGSYPCWVFSLAKMQAYFKKHYQILFEFDALEGQMVSNGLHISSKGFFLGKQL